MYKLTIISGPNRGSSYEVKEGETSIGRQTTNVVVLTSSKVSKKHCTLVVDHSEITVRDEGSSNGTFVNGVLTKSRHMNAGDRISVGEFVLELSSQDAVKPAAAKSDGSQSLAQVLQFPSGGLTRTANQGAYPSTKVGGAAPHAMGDFNHNQPNLKDQMPTDLKGKALWMFESKLMPAVYAFNLKYEWRTLALFGMILFVVLNLLVSVQPLLEAGRVMIEKESRLRAQYMAREIVSRNTVFVASRQETKAEIGDVIKKEPGVRLALLIDLDGRIIAPGDRFNQYLASGPEALFVRDMKKAFDEGREIGGWKKVDDDTVVAVEPVKIVSAQLGKNVITAMSVVSLDTSLSVPSVGEIGMAYSQVLVISVIIAGFILAILYKLTLRPFQVLNDDLDEALKGELHQVTHEYRFEELDGLWNNVNSALQRIPKGDAGLGGSSTAGDSVTAEDFAGGVRGMMQNSKMGVCICDSEHKVVYMNNSFEEVTGIRLDNAMNSDIATQARDQGFASLIHDLFERVQAGNDGVGEEFEFSGVPYRVAVTAFATSTGSVKAKMMSLTKGEG